MFSSPSNAEQNATINGNHPLEAERFRPLGQANPEDLLTMRIRFALRNAAQLDRLILDQQDSASPQYRKWIKPAEFFKTFGPTRSDMDAVVDWLGAEGFTVTHREPGSIEFVGRVAQAQRTFAISIAKFGDGSLFANTSDPIVPQRFANVIAAVAGMDNMIHASPASRRSAHPDSVVGDSQAFGPLDMRTFYDEIIANGNDGSGDCIAIVGTSDFLDSTAAAFTTQFGLPAINYSRKLHGTNPGLNGAQQEAELDLQWAHAAAPGASIVYHLGNDLVADINGAVNDNTCGTISISFGFCGTQAAFMSDTIDPLFKQAAAQGQSVFVSAGDQGAAGLGLDPITNSCETGSARSVNEMSADPNVTSVGGTQFLPTYASGQNQGYAFESGWNDASGSTGGGTSQVFVKPSYQKGPGVPNDGLRDVPDLALIASPNSPGVLFADNINGTAQVICCIGGTSLSAPILAGFSRVIAQMSGSARLGNLNPIIYKLANQQYATAGFHDVTNGNNNFNGVNGFAAGPGYDQVTGWGTIDFDIFANAVSTLLAPSPIPTASPTPTVAATPTPSGSATPTTTTVATPVPSPAPPALPQGGSFEGPSSIRFPTTGVGLGTTSKTVLIKNKSRTSTLSVSVGTMTAPFALSGAGIQTVLAGGSIPVTIFFAPSSIGSINQVLTINSGDRMHPLMRISVGGLVEGGRISVTKKISIQSPAIGVATSKTIMLKNSGRGMLVGSVAQFALGSLFNLVGGSVPFSLAPGQTRGLTVQFQPSSGATVAGSFLIESATSAAATSILVTGTVRRLR